MPVPFEDLKGSPLYDRLTKGTPLAISINGVDHTPRFESLVGKLPPGREIVPPEGGWKERTYYVVEVAWSSANPIHRAILYVGFINNVRRPLSGSYTTMFQASFEGLENPEGAYYLRSVCEIKEMSHGR